MLVMVTRPQGDAEPLSQKLRARGHEVITAPLLAVRYLDQAPIALDAINGLIATSRHALLAVERRPDIFTTLRDLPVFTVGAATADCARRLGFSSVIEGPGSIKGLLPLITRRGAGSGAGDCDCGQGRGSRFLYLAGSHRAADLASLLQPHAIALTTCIVYDMAACDSLDPMLVTRLERETALGVLLMSPRTAEIYCRLVAQHGLLAPAVGWTYFCTSETIAGVVRERLMPAGLPAHAIKVPPGSVQGMQEMLALVDVSAKQEAAGLPGLGR